MTTTMDAMWSSWIIQPRDVTATMLSSTVNPNVGIRNLRPRTQPSARNQSQLLSIQPKIDHCCRMASE